MFYDFLNSNNSD